VSACEKHVKAIPGNKCQERYTADRKGRHDEHCWSVRCHGEEARGRGGQGGAKRHQQNGKSKEYCHEMASTRGLAKCQKEKKGMTKKPENGDQGN